MHVVLGHVREIVVHDVRQLFDVDAARGNVGRHQHLQCRGLEFRKRAGARTLAFVAVNRERGDAVLVELLGELVGAVLGAREHQHLKPVTGLDQVREQFALTVAVDGMDFLRRRLDGGVAARDFDHRRMIEQRVGEISDLVRERRREQQILSTLREHCENAADIPDEAHVEHAIGLVEHQNFDSRQVDAALPMEVDQAARRRD